MPDSLKLGISLLILVSMFFLCVSVALIFIKESEKDKRLVLEAELNKILETNKELSQDMDELKVINDDLEAKLSNAQQDIESLTNDFNREKETRLLAAAELDEQKKDVKKLVSEAMAQKEEKISLVQKLAQAENEYQKLKAQLEIVSQAKETLEQKMKELIAQRGVELEKIVVQPGSPAETTLETALPALIPQVNTAEETPQAEILVVNKNFNFLIVNVGKTNGLNVGDTIEIYRNKEFLAEAQIEKLYDNMSAATILPQYRKIDIKPGDNVIVRR